MDELFELQSAEKVVRPSTKTLQQRLDNALFRWDSFKEKHHFKARYFLAAAAVIGIATTATTVYTRGYQVTVDGKEMGIIADPATVEETVERVEDRVGEILGREYTLDNEITFQSKIVDKNHLTSLTGLENYLFNQVGEVTKTHVLSIGGQDMGATMDGAGLSAILEVLKAPYVNENTVSAQFTVPVEVRYEYTSTAELKPLEDFKKLLMSNSIEAATYSVEAGNTYYGIAQKHGMTLEELMDMNPQADLNRLMVGDVLTVRQSVPYLSVRTVDAVTYQEAIPSPVEYVDDDTMYKGDTKVLEPGTEGSQLVSAQVTSVNGVEQSRDITATKVLSEPTVKKVAQGTKPRPKTMPTGHLKWPVRGTVTSNYGGRSLFGTYNFHGGLDIACAYGTSVKASDGGKVIFAGWQGSYGKLVVIDHENGKQTYYAHNSSLNVSVGQRVYQGQTIAKVGTTGRTSGPHCHFEVRINGQRTNPRSYLP